jgi:hypothetical protein
VPSGATTICLAWPILSAKTVAQKPFGRLIQLASPAHADLSSANAAVICGAEIAPAIALRPSAAVNSLCIELSSI